MFSSPYLLSTINAGSGAGGGWRLIPVPLTNSKLFIIYARTNDLARAIRWDGANFGTEITTTSKTVYRTYISAVAEGDDVHFLFSKYSNYDIIYTKYTYSVNGFGSETTIYSELPNGSASSITIDRSNGDLYAFQVISDCIYYKKNVDGAWDSEPTLVVNASVYGFDLPYRINVFSEVSHGLIGILYKTGLESPFSVWFTVLNLSDFRYATTNWQLDTVDQDPSRSNTGNLTTTTITMSTFHVVVFTSTIQYYLDLSTTVSGSTIGATGSQTEDSWFDIDTETEISATTPYLNGTTTKFYFTYWIWSKGGVQQSNSVENPLILTMDNCVNVEANWSYDRIILYYYTVTDTRCDLNTNQNISMKFRWENDSSPVDSDWIISINGNPETVTDSWLNLTDSSVSVLIKTWVITYANGGSNYINAVTPQIIWDRIIITFTPNKANPSVGEYVTFTVTLKYESDNTALTSYSYSIDRNSTSYLTNFSYPQFNDQKMSSGTYVYNFTGLTDLNNGIIGFVDPADLSIVWSLPVVRYASMDLFAFVFVLTLVALTIALSKKD